MFETVEEIRDGVKREAALELLTQLYPERGLETIRTEIDRMLAQQDWRMVGIFDGDECIATLLVHTGYRMYCGKFIRMDSMVIDEDRRSEGLGQVLLEWTRKEGKRLGCEILLLDSFVTNHHGHRFFFREGMQISGYHFTLALS